MSKYSNQTHYECYATRIREELLALGYKPKHIYTHRETNNVCYVFKLTPGIEKIIAKNSDPNKVRQMKEKKKSFKVETINKHRNNQYEHRIDNS